jgi:hypothetical protein
VQSPGRPFRCDLVTPDQVGSLLGGTAEPDLWFASELITAAGQLVARSGGGDLFLWAAPRIRCSTCSAAYSAAPTTPVDYTASP